MKVSFSFRILFTILICSSLTIVFLKITSSSLEGKYINIAKSKAKNIVVERIISSLEDISLNTSLIKKDEEIVSYNVDSINLLLKRLNKKIILSFEEDTINKNDKEELNKKGIMFFLPFSLAYNNIFFSVFNPYIPVKLLLEGNVISKCEAKVEKFGINNALITIYIKVIVNVHTILPFVSELESVEYISPIAMDIFKGNIPSSMIGSYDVSSKVKEV